MYILVVSHTFWRGTIVEEFGGGGIGLISYLHSSALLLPPNETLTCMPVCHRVNCMVNVHVLGFSSYNILFATSGIGY